MDRNGILRAMHWLCKRLCKMLDFTQSPVAVFAARISLGRQASNARQSLLQILDQVGWVLQPDRQADAAGADADRGPLGLGEPLMGTGRGVGDQALAVAEIVGNPDDAQAVHQPESLRLAARDV